ncbi:hypothetical protein [Dyadobacter frigoris]|uniref:Uncharacterized protein n=1 Tax=Dyadobacter frigoris TaxID=2576211 RepID=A0A4U6D193_9BACT|nr:hypothetical protein [Dyadobacter frigoris]TKT90979.1 hypothetical protein FDK13_18645 [Dyadobacter frigoris]GLU56168.1 hypothetical protein Dfri01_56290 [Dyadobacter frigoris]
MSRYLKGFESNATNAELIEVLDQAVGILYNKSAGAESNGKISNGPVGYELYEMPDGVVTKTFEILTCKAAVGNPAEDLAEKLYDAFYAWLVEKQDGEALIEDFEGPKDKVPVSYIVTNEPYFVEPFKNLGVNFDLKADIDHRTPELFGEEFAKEIVWTYTFEVRICAPRKG